MGALRWLLDARLEIAGSVVLWREIIGNVFGLASALLGMRRLVWAWPIGMIGNALLFTVFLGGAFATPQAVDLYGQAGRQVFFFAVSVYGWWRWSRNRRQHASPDEGAVVPRWATNSERLVLLGTVIVGMAVAYPILKALGSWGPLPDSWILVGSLLATYGMARGWVEFWLVWIAVDAVGVPLLLQGGFYPSAAMYGVYGLFCVWGFVSWLRTSRALRQPQVQAPSYVEGRV
ncbi:nicotinamide mononucleotide transporter [Planosporangium flavigriseum]|uniref:Nicotinamide mononucleotide transporter n=1 Tax=Planosporangium flavigriseum TaxID=373681 RepID=A0A8J3M227_9ACTN|nr:nicotinamide riboside transporter PnuC [Planosporangium flavigriseum]NJC66324.1 nicotinamide mononucleotide transporter [Planosporangium flavigriseum]GIG75285.1 nicotinamide mononucleotide transporter [Planosporangium flavigriseum]